MEDVTGALVEALRLARDGGARAERLSVGDDDALLDLKTSSSQLPQASPKLATERGPTDLLDLQVQLEGLSASIRALSEQEDGDRVVPLQNRGSPASQIRDVLEKEMMPLPAKSASSSSSRIPPMHFGTKPTVEKTSAPSRSVLASPPPPPRPPMPRAQDQSSAKQAAQGRAPALTNYARHLRENILPEGEDERPIVPTIPLDAHLNAMQELEHRLRTPLSLSETRRMPIFSEGTNPMFDRRRVSKASNYGEGPAPRFGYADNLGESQSINEVSNVMQTSVTHVDTEYHDNVDKDIEQRTEVTDATLEPPELPQWAKDKKPKTPLLDKKSSLWIHENAKSAVEEPDMPPLSMPGAKKRGLVDSAPTTNGPNLLQHMADSKAIGVPMAVVGIDANHNGRSDFLYVGADLDGDGIPDDLQEDDQAAHLGSVEEEDQESQGGYNCSRCKVLFVQVKALTQSLAGLGSIVFNWSSNLHTSHRHTLARMVLQYTLPCSHIDESLQNVVEELRGLFGDDLIESDVKISEAWQHPQKAKQSQEAVTTSDSQSMPAPRGLPTSLGPGQAASQRSLATHAWSRNMACNDAMTSEMTRDPLTGRLKLDAFAKQNSNLQAGAVKTGITGPKKNNEFTVSSLQQQSLNEPLIQDTVVDADSAGQQQTSEEAMSPGLIEILDGFIDEYDHASVSEVIPSPQRASPRRVSQQQSNSSQPSSPRQYLRQQQSSPQGMSPRHAHERGEGQYLGQQQSAPLGMSPRHAHQRGEGFNVSAATSIPHQDLVGDIAYQRGKNWVNDAAHPQQLPVVGEQPTSSGHMGFYQSVQHSLGQRQNAAGRNIQGSQTQLLAQPAYAAQQNQRDRAGRLLQKALRREPNDSDESITGEEATQPKVWL